VPLSSNRGRFLARAGKTELIEGGPEPKRIVIIEFPDAAGFKRWYNSPEYQKILPGRLDNSRARLRCRWRKSVSLRRGRAAQQGANGACPHPHARTASIKPPRQIEAPRVAVFWCSRRGNDVVAGLREPEGPMPREAGRSRKPSIRASTRSSGVLPGLFACAVLCRR
jgi:hypothetical protein